ncbi:hypothetical protein EJ04DRAFT_571337 [Polyplosphaeria fusca]|uniref:Secreted protein n=1 Tax=Polyplosphaeria fusca TaxID=682080 RepID=A0A9P4QFL1_9PLEO|nr:hypothetical protein EJ04DRAFT_571337 [Polyplosphaeria fusca]
MLQLFIHLFVLAIRYSNHLRCLGYYDLGRGRGLPGQPVVYEIYQDHTTGPSTRLHRVVDPHGTTHQIHPVDDIYGYP